MSTYIPTLQEEVNRKAFDSVADLVALVESGVVTPSYANLMLSVLQTAFNGIVTDGDFCGLLTELSSNLSSLLPMKQTLSVTLNKPECKDIKIEIEGCRIIVDGNDRTLDTPIEAYNTCLSLVRKLEIAGYKPVKV